MESLSSEEEAQVKRVKRLLETWREFLVFVSALLLWEKSWFPGVLISAVTSVFTLHWYFSPSVLTTLSIVGLAATLLDFIVPQISAILSPPEQWTGPKERAYEKICQHIVSAQTFLLEQWAGLKSLKEVRPKTYFVLMFSVLTTSAWVGSVVSNLFLAYLGVCGLVLFPGMYKYGIAQRFASILVLTLADSIKSARTDQDKVKRS